MSKLSVCISAYNAQERLEDCLKSAQFADEIIVVNNSSTDKTVDIAKKYTSKIFTRQNNLMLNKNKNFGFTKATNEWIFCLDDDERITTELKKEIESVLENEKLDVNGYYMPRKNIIFGKWIERTGWYPDPQLRLFRKGKGKFEEKHVHEMIKIEGKTEYLKEPIQHLNYQNISQFLSKMSNIYVPNEAEVLMGKGYKAEFADSIKFPLKEFLTRFFAQEGYKDGFHGLMLSILMAFYHFCIFAFIWEKQGFAELGNNTLEEFNRQSQTAGKDIKYWIKQSKIRSTKNPAKKIFYKVLGK